MMSGLQVGPLGVSQTANISLLALSKSDMDGDGGPTLYQQRIRPEVK